jgi:hypothetical protein
VVTPSSKRSDTFDGASGITSSFPGVDSMSVAWAAATPDNGPDRMTSPTTTATQIIAREARRRNTAGIVGRDPLDVRAADCGAFGSRRYCLAADDPAIPTTT